MRSVSEDFKAELGRANYVTPTSYLELITMFQRLVTAKRIENSKTLSRYTVGLEKLQSSAQQVAGMQQELRVSTYHTSADLSSETACICLQVLRYHLTCLLPCLQQDEKEQKDKVMHVINFVSLIMCANMNGCILDCGCSPH